MFRPGGAAGGEYRFAVHLTRGYRSRWPNVNRFFWRIDRDTLDAVQRWANDDLRSLNGQVEFLLRRALQQNGRALQQNARAPKGDIPQADMPGTEAANNIDPVATKPPATERAATEPVANDIPDDDNFSD